MKWNQIVRLLSLSTCASFCKMAYLPNLQSNLALQVQVLCPPPNTYPVAEQVADVVDAIQDHGGAL